MLKNEDETVLMGKAARRRLRWFVVHILSFVIGMSLLVAVNLMVAPSEPWFVALLVAWGAPLAIHVAFVMGLFDSLLGLK